MEKVQRTDGCGPEELPSPNDGLRYVLDPLERVS